MTLLYRTETELESSRAELSESFYRQHELNQLLKDECEHLAFLEAQVEELRGALRRRELEKRSTSAPADVEQQTQQQQLVEQLRHELETQAELLHGEQTRCMSLSDQLLALGEQHSRLQARLEEADARIRAYGSCGTSRGTGEPTSYDCRRGLRCRPRRRNGWSTRRRRRRRREHWELCYFESEFT